MFFPHTYFKKHLQFRKDKLFEIGKSPGNHVDDSYKNSGKNFFFMMGFSWRQSRGAVDLIYHLYACRRRTK
jgi:hypothetical protein